MRLRWNDVVWALVSGAGVALCFFLPCWSELSNGAFWLSPYEVFLNSSNPEPLFGGGVDVLGSFWMVHEVGEMLTGQQESILRDVYAPFGYDLGIHTGFAWLDALMAVPLSWLIGVPGFYNLHIFVVILIGFASVQLVLRRIGLSWPLVFAIAQLAFVHSYVIGELISGRPTQVYVLFPCLFVLALMNIQDLGWRFRDGILAGLALGASCLVYWFGGAAVGLCGVVVCLGLLWQLEAKAKGIGVGICTALVALASTLLVSWRSAVPLLKGRGKRAYSKMDVEPMATIDLGVVELPVQRIVDISTSDKLLESIKDSELSLVYVMVFFLCLLNPLAWKRKWPWGLGAILAIGFPFGSALSWSAGKWAPTGFVLLHGVFPPMVRCQYFERLQFAFVLCALVVIGITMQECSRRYLMSTKRMWVAALLLMGINLHQWPTADKVKTSKYEVFDELAEELSTKQGAIMEVPFLYSNVSYVQQIWHRRPINGGPGLDTVREGRHQRYFSRNGLYHQLEQIASGMVINQSVDATDLLRLRKDGFRWVVVHLSEQKGDPDEYRRYLRNEGMLLEDGRILLLPLPVDVVE